MTANTPRPTRSTRKSKVSKANGTSTPAKSTSPTKTKTTKSTLKKTKQQSTTTKSGKSSTKSNTTTTNGNKRSKRRLADVEEPSTLDAAKTPMSSKITNTVKDVNVHRCRFVDWVPDAVHVLAGNAKGDRLAVGRAGSDIEIWRLTHGWHQLGVVPGKVATDDEGDEEVAASLHMIRSLVWAGNRLFGAGLDGMIFEVDFETMTKTNVTDSMGGPVWSLDVSADGNTLAAGCEDGRIRFFDISSTYVIDFKRAMAASSATRVLCVKFDVEDEDVVFSSGADGSITKWSTSSAQALVDMQVEKFGSTDAVNVWSLQCLGDGMIVAGDSRGHVEFWDARMGTLLFSFQEHVADVFSLAVSRDRSMVFASGTDSRIAMFQKVPGTEETPEKWVYGYSYRPHTHDVRSLTIVTSPTGNHTAPGEAVVSGGDDTQLCWCSVRHFGKMRPNKVPSFRHSNIAHISDVLAATDDQAEQLDDKTTTNLQSRNLLVQHQRRLELYQLTVDAGADALAQPRHQDMARFVFKGNLTIRCSALSRDGQWVASGDDNGLRVFKVDTRNEDHVQYDAFCHIAPSMNGIPVAAKFTNDRPCTRLVVVFHTGHVAVYSLQESESTKAHKKRSDFQLSSEGTFQLDKCGVRSIAISRCSKWMAISTNKESVHLFDLGELQLKSAIPKEIFGGKAHACMDFHPTETSTLAVVGTDNKFYLYLVAEERLSDFSVYNTEGIPKELTNYAERATGIAFDPSTPRKLVLWGPGYMCSVNLDDAEKGGAPKRRRKDALRLKSKDANVTSEQMKQLPTVTKSACSVKFVKDFKPILFLEFVGPKEMLVLEANWVKVMASFPSVLQRQRYGGGQ